MAIIKPIRKISPLATAKERMEERKNLAPPKIKVQTSVLKPEQNNSTISPVGNSVGVTVTKGDSFSVGLPPVTSAAPVTSPVGGSVLQNSVLHVAPSNENNGGISGTDIFTAQQLSSTQGEDFSSFDDDGQPLPIQKKVSSWLSKFLPTVETDVNFPDRRPLYIAIGGIILAILLFKFIKKR